MIKIEESYVLFIDALSRLDECKLNLSDEDLAYEIFEQLDIENHSFLHEWTVDRLIERGFIPVYIRQRILRLRENIRPLMEEKHDIQLYRNDPDWEALRKEAKSIMNEIKTANNHQSN